MNREAVQEGEEKVGGSRIKQEMLENGAGSNAGDQEEIAGGQDQEEQEDQDYFEAVLLSLEQVRSRMEAIEDPRRFVRVILSKCHMTKSFSLYNK